MLLLMSVMQEVRGRTEDVPLNHFESLGTRVQSTSKLFNNKAFWVEIDCDVQYVVSLHALMNTTEVNH